MVAQSQQQAKQPFWEKTWFIESNWISVSTKWLLTLGGKAARLVLIICTLYMSAQLYPGVVLPPGLNLAVFIVLSFALDMGGLGLAQIAKTAREQGNIEGAEQGEKLSTWLIGIMIAGLVTVSLEHAADMIPLTQQWKNIIAVFWIVVEIALSIARVICAVNYGRVIHALERSVEQSHSRAHEEQETQRAELTRLRQEVSTLRPQLDSAKQQVDTLHGQVDTLNGRLQEKLREVDTLHGQVDSEQRRVSTLQEALETGHGDTAGLRRELNKAQVEAETLRTQLEGKQQEIEGLREQLQSGQEWQGSRVSNLQQELEAEQATATALRRQLHVTQLDAETLRTQLEGKQQEIERVQSELTRGQQEVSTLQRKLDSANGNVDTLRGQVDTLQRKLDSGQEHSVDSGQPLHVDSGQTKVVRLDTNRPRKSGQGSTADGVLGEQIRTLLLAEPGLSDRAIATRLSCSPTTVGKWRKQSDQEPEECVNE